jgi:3-dehydroquinate synthase
VTGTLRVAGSEVRIGALGAGLERLAAHRGPLPLISDARVLGLHGGPLLDRLPVEPLLVPEGEEAKRWPVLEALLHGLARLDPARDTPVLLLGGGSIGDVGGLAASLFKRGCPTVFIPTTLLAQADSAVGGKTGIDFADLKNLVGTFHPPTLVLADPSLLATLPARELHAGYAEVVKYGLIDDPDFFAWCEADGASVPAGHLPNTEFAVRHGLAAKGRAVEGDERDRSGQRALLNLGHSFAHAIEAEAGLGRVLHGEAVAIGLVLAHRLSARLGLCPPADSARVERHLASVGLPVRLADVGVSGTPLLAPMRADKKNEGGGLNLVLSHGIGRAFLARGVPVDAVASFLAEA